jgi:hypothetical protein
VAVTFRLTGRDANVNLDTAHDTGSSPDT